MTATSRPLGRLVGREAQLEALGAALDGLAQGAPAAIEVAGEPGIGKSRLLAELEALADARGCLVLRGTASEFERDLPFWVFVDALEEYVLSLDPQRLDFLDDAARADLAQVLPALSPEAAPGPLLQDERYRIHRALSALLERLARQTPLVLLLDDLHWADSGSVELLGAVLRRLPAAPLLLVVALRPRQASERLAATLERGRRAGSLTRLELGELTLQEARQLLAGALDGDEAAAIYRSSGGNPFYLEQLARTAGGGGEGGPPLAVRLGGVEVPSSVVNALAEELALLSDDARRALEGAAVVGDPFEPELAAAAAAMSEPATLAGLDELLRRDLARPTDVPRRFRFRHPLVRRAVYEASPGGWRLTAHERSAAALAARGASAASLAHHVEQAGRQGDREAVAVLRRAGDALASRAPAGAARWFGAALRLLPDSAGWQERVDLLTTLAGAQAATGQFEDARAALLEAIDLVPRAEVAVRVRLATSCARIEQLMGRHTEARTRLEGTLATLDDPASAEAVALMITLSLDSFYRPMEGRERMRARTIELARALGDRPLLAWALATSAMLEALASDAADTPHRAEAAALVDAMPDDELAGRLEAIVMLLGAEAYLERFDDAIAHARRGAAVARATSQSVLLPTLVPAHFTALWMRGRLADAVELLEGAIEAARLVGNSQTIALLLLNRGLVGALMGDLELATQRADDAWHIAREIEDSIVPLWAGVCLGLVRLEAGEPAGAVEMITAAGGDDAVDIPGMWRALVLDWLTRAFLALGRPDEAERTAAVGAEVAAVTPLRLASCWATRSAAAVALDRGDASGAAERAFASAALADEVGAAMEAACSRALAGSALAAAGRADEAAALLAIAAAELDACGAARHRDRVERELRRLGVRASRTPRTRSAGSGVEALSNRELQVARLVVERRTNPEIAEALVVSLKTVETHMRHIFEKLGVSSRVEVARVVERTEAGEPTP